MIGNSAALRRAFGALVGISFALIIACLYAAKHWYETPVDGLAGQTLLVPAGSTFGELVATWQRAEQIQTPVLWRLAGKATGVESRIQAGEYQMPDRATPKTVLQRLSAGQGQVSYSVAFIEGWTVREMRKALREAPHLRHTLAEIAQADLLAELGFAPGPAEGWFFPDTYTYNRGASDREVLRRAHEQMRRVLADAWDERTQGLKLASPYEALILASIVEKETGRGSDRPTIAQVFNRRLQLGMKLQTDPTVIYGVGADFAGDITYAHLRTDTPYNTYTRFGLPPTPIALPGKASIEAALQPAEGEYLYFVARGDGTSQFSKSLVEHNAAVRRYQLKR